MKASKLSQKNKPRRSKRRGSPAPAQARPKKTPSRRGKTAAAPGVRPSKTPPRRLRLNASYELLASHSRDIILFVNRRTGRILDANTAAVKQYGYTRRELLALSISDLRTPQTRPLTAMHMAMAAAKSVQFETVHQRKDGSTFPVEVSSRGARVGNARILISIVRDITDRKQMEEARDRSDAKLRAVFRSLVEGVLFMNRDGVVEEINDAVQKLHGHTLEQFEDPKRDPRRQLLRADGSICPEDEQAGNRALRTGEPVHNMEVGVRCPDGSIRWRLVNAQPVRDDAGQMIGAVVSFFDITERKQAEIALEQARAELREHAESLEKTVRARTAQLQELVAELEHFSYSITHDLRAPLRAMRGYSEILAESLGDSAEPDVKMFLERITRAAERMDLLITDALSYSKTVRQELPLCPIDLGALLQEILDTYAGFQATHADIQLEAEIPAVMANEAGLTQCFSNLLGNAVKFVAPSERPSVRIWAETIERAPTAPDRSTKGGSPWEAVGTVAGGTWVRVWVEDKGIGIPENMRPRIFDMFSRAHREYEGTGIGLALVRKVVQRMGGKVGVESEVGRGSRFWIELQPA